jgi:hypothetical protein
MSTSLSKFSGDRAKYLAWKEEVFDLAFLSSSLDSQGLLGFIESPEEWLAHQTAAF